MGEDSLDQLADLIVSRVKKRLDASDTLDGRPLCGHENSCLLPKPACSNCGLNPINIINPIYQAPKETLSGKDLARYIDHTHLRPDADRDEIKKLCQEAKKHQFFSVCVNSSNVNLANRYLSGSDVKVCAVVGFPLGAATSGSKAFEAKEAVRCGASEIDMVLNIGALRSLSYGLVLEDIRRVTKAVPGKIVKVILETGMLNDSEKSLACGLAKAAGAHFVKTSTGFGPGGATVEDVALMRKLVGPDMGVKASGGIRDATIAQAMLKAGASRLGASSSVAIVTGGTGKSGY